MEGIVICSGSAVDVTGVPEEIRILPLGHVKSRKGDFLVDDESARMIMDQFKSRQVDLVIDYEHQTLKDVQAPAGGWIEDVRRGEDAIIAKVRWTDRAMEYLKNREYRYLSPVVMVRKSDHRAAAIHSVALTNTPAIDGMFPIVNSMGLPEDEKEEEEKMDLKKIAELLGLPGTATEEDVTKALAAAKEAGGQKDEPKEDPEETTEAAVPVANSTVLGLLGLPETAKTEDVTAAIMACKAGSRDPELEALKQELKEHAAEEMVMAALKEGKITAAQKEWAKEYALSDKAGFASFVDKAPVVVPQGKLDDGTAGRAEAKSQECDPVILKECGLSAEDVKKYFNKEGQTCIE